ncbi:MAG: succinylglutamate desuccinylase [Alphaproteobacteria bacterium]|jgi:predicted deacylase|nr:succinylglutamate desuccinylase [Alphaproteobacteria bacterium]
MAARLTLPLGGTNPGTSRTLTVFRFGAPGARPKVHIQAGLHAEELPGMLAAHYLVGLLRAADQAGHVRGEVQVIPMANPVGLDQFVDERLLGRSALGGGGNFNRHYPDLTERVYERVHDRLSEDPVPNIALIRKALAEAVQADQPRTEIGCLRHTLLRQAITADIVLDLHCDEEAPVHLYLGTPLWPDAQDLARQLGARAVLLAEVSGGEPFDEACSAPWWHLRALVDDRFPIPAACLAATVELRGMADVSDDLAEEDARNLFAFLQRRGAVAGDPGPLPPMQAEATPLAGVDMVAAPDSGILTYRVDLGAAVTAGQIIADITDPLAEDPAGARVPVATVTAGLLWSRAVQRFVRRGDILAKVAGSEPLPGKGRQLLTD